MIAVYKRELNSYFNSMIGYVFIAILIAFVGFYFMIYNLYNGYPKFSYTLQATLYIFMVAIPILTMKSMSEDRKSKSDQLLLTSPITLSQLVMGKYLAMVTVWLIPTAVFCLCPTIIASTGTSYLVSDFSTILALFFMGCAQIAIGLFISSLTESQVIASVGTFGVLLLLFLWEGIVDYLPSALGNILGAFSFTGPFYNFSSYDVFDVGGLVLYISLAFLFIFITIQLQQKRRWN